MSDTITQLHKDLKLFKRIVICFSILAIACTAWHKDNMQNLISSLIFISFFIVVGILGWLDTIRAIKLYKKYCLEQG
ncbi:hypothetical protein [Campylobacter concisus]|uniref:hypothetical protein n=1 Tax=Campylobacter concisus TaxID=199 RepID=UPI000CD9A46F|nr:hypothetical protein [Campylobacter concisus]